MRTIYFVVQSSPCQGMIRIFGDAFPGGEGGGRGRDGCWREITLFALIGEGGPCDDSPSEKRPMFDEEHGSLFLILNQKAR